MWMIMDRKKAGKWSGKGNWTTPVELHTGEDEVVVQV
jgi:hypothetical protein